MIFKIFQKLFKICANITNYEYKEIKPTSNSTLLEGERKKRKEKNLYTKIMKRHIKLCDTYTCPYFHLKSSTSGMF